jgi:hypothetical protein
MLFRRCPPIMSGWSMAQLFKAHDIDCAGDLIFFAKDKEVSARESVPASSFFTQLQEPAAAGAQDHRNAAQGSGSGDQVSVLGDHVDRTAKPLSHNKTVLDHPTTEHRPGDGLRPQQPRPARRAAGQSRTR